MKNTSLSLALTAALLLLPPARGDDAQVARAMAQRKGIDLLTATSLLDGKGHVMLVEFKPRELRGEYLHLPCIVVTTRPALAARINGTVPKGINTSGVSSILYSGDLTALHGDEIKVRTTQPGQPGSFATASIPVKDVDYVVFPRSMPADETIILDNSRR